MIVITMKLPAFDVMGSIAIAEIPNGVDEKEAARKILETNRHIRSVYKKVSAREGTFRIRKIKLIGGENKSVTVHKENGILLEMNVRKVYFSPREGTERMRIVEKVNALKPRAELGMVFFSGIGGTPILLSKRTSTKYIVGIDINPDAVRYFSKNITLNKVSNVLAVLGDVRKETRKYYGKCDFVSMPLPETGWKYLRHAIRCLKTRGICFFYALSSEEDLYGKWIKKIHSVSKQLGRKAVIIEKRKVLPYAARIWKIRIDFQID